MRSRFGAILLVMGELIVLTGPPGAGKSTVGVQLVERYDPSVRVEGDAFFAFLAKGAIDPWLPESAPQNDVVTEAAARAAGVFAGGPYTVVYEGVVGPWYVPLFAASTGVVGLHYVILLPSLQHCVDRVGGRFGHGFTDVPATQHMHRQFAEAEVDRRHVIPNEGDDVTAVVDEIVGGVADGRFRLEAPTPA